MVSFPQFSPPKPCMHLFPMRATCPAYLLDLITRVIFGEDYRSTSRSKCILSYNHHSAHITRVPTTRNFIRTTGIQSENRNLDHPTGTWITQQETRANQTWWWGSHSGVADDSSLLRCYAVLSGKQLPTFDSAAVACRVQQCCRHSVTSHKTRI